MNKPDGGYAFPHSYANGEYTTDGGMTLRQWYAGLAMQGLMDAVKPSFVFTGDTTLARICFSISDAMIAEGEK